MRLDQYLIEKIPMPLSEIRRQIEQGLCKVNHAEVRDPTCELKRRDLVYLGQMRKFIVEASLCQVDQP